MSTTFDFQTKVTATFVRIEEDGTTLVSLVDDSTPKRRADRNAPSTLDVPVEPRQSTVTLNFADDELTDDSQSPQLWITLTGDPSNGVGTIHVGDRAHGGVHITMGAHPDERHKINRWLRSKEVLELFALTWWGTDFDPPFEVERGWDLDSLGAFALNRLRIAVGERFPEMAIRAR